MSRESWTSSSASPRIGPSVTRPNDTLLGAVEEHPLDPGAARADDAQRPPRARADDELPVQVRAQHDLPARVAEVPLPPPRTAASPWTTSTVLRGRRLARLCDGVRRASPSAARKVRRKDRRAPHWREPRAPALTLPRVHVTLGRRRQEGPDGTGGQSLRHRLSRPLRAASDDRPPASRSLALFACALPAAGSEPQAVAGSATIVIHGQGRVTSEPAGAIDCPGDCSHSFTGSTSLTLRATPATGWATAQNAFCGETDVCTVSLNDFDYTIHVYFRPRAKLQVWPNGDGAITLRRLRRTGSASPTRPRARPDTAFAGTGCELYYLPGTAVTATAAAAGRARSSAGARTAAPARAPAPSRSAATRPRWSRASPRSRCA